ncbi:protein FAR1-RELATED SEQUENCE 5-like [Chenopodium quinoa]|uniref:protein FAR1-RELATED SEQUENCE 5-like n=1 Tax=Chenopodium quinoa TaxID=63459 RepID=UPI000B782CD1|nr:protein FAR1-RELATED SEQUENCE 5-like [Chenopodium quinoa]
MDLNRSIQDTIENFDINVINFDLNEAVEDEEQAIIEAEDDNEVHDENQSLMKPQGASNNDEISGWLVGETRATLAKIHELYCQHAAAVGFSVRKAKQTSKIGTKDIITKKFFVCSAAGLRNSSKKKEKIAEELLTEETKLNEEGQFEIVQHVLVHNHPLTRPQWNHFHRSERAMTRIKGQVIEAMQESRLRPMESFNYMSNEAGGEDAIGHTVKDHMNYCYKLKIKAIEGGDSQSKVDSDGRVWNLFWRDSMMLEDYKIYGDVTVFDTTYRTNRYNLICAPFVGINNHWKNTMFACSFIGDETTDSFVWLFETFKKVFPNTRHRLCLWHLIQNAVTRFGVLKSDDTFKAAFMKCLSGCINEAQFEVCWDSMMTKYKLKNNSWFKRLYSLKHKWSTALSKDFFSAGILSSQRSESTNHAVGFKANKKTSLTEFYNIFQKTVKTWRRNEDFYEFNSIKSIPTSSYPMSALLKHAAEVYTHTLFRDFEEEFNLAIGSQTKLLFINGDKMVYQVYLEGRDGTTQAVNYDPVNQTIQCPCKNFEESGWLCFHSLRILHMYSVEKIPEQYISIRWTKVAKDKVWESIEAEQRKKGTLNNFTPWRLHMSTDYHSENTTGVEENSEATSSNVVQVLDPARAKTKGGQSNKRIPGSYDYMKKGKRRKHREFGAKTPNINNKYML